MDAGLPSTSRCIALSTLASIALLIAKVLLPSARFLLRPFPVLPCSRLLQDGMQSSACAELQRIALACSDQGASDALLLQTSAWVLADMQRLTVPASPLQHALQCALTTRML